MLLAENYFKLISLQLKVFSCLTCTIFTTYNFRLPSLDVSWKSSKRFMKYWVLSLLHVVFVTLQVCHYFISERKYVANVLAPTGLYTSGMIFETAIAFAIYSKRSEIVELTNGMVAFEDCHNGQF